VSNDIPFYNLTRVLRGGWVVIIATILAFGLLGGVAGVLWPTTYDATATVEVNGEDAQAINMQTEQTIARSTGVLTAAQSDLTGWTVGGLRDALTVTVPKDADVLQLTVSDGSGKRAADAANAVAAAYLQDRREATDEQQQRGLELLEAQIKRFDSQINDTTSEVRKQVLESRLAALSEQYAAVRADLYDPCRVLSDAEVPDAPSSPAVTVWVAGGLVAGALIGFYIATVIYRVRRSKSE
jgi:uncharacterized protein involved in exopolysaccharide biosynthesis